MLQPFDALEQGKTLRDRCSRRSNFACGSSVGSFDIVARSKARSVEHEAQIQSIREVTFRFK